MPTVYLNGQFLPLEEARIPVMDRGFLFGDGVYEVIPVYSRRPFRLGQHLDRLEASLDAIRLENPHTRQAWENLIRRCIEQAESEDLGIYLQVTRGSGPRDHAFPKIVQPTVFILPLPLNPPAPELVECGVAAITALDNRWLRCDIKATSLLPNVLLRQLAVDAGCAETLLLRDGHVSEGAASNLFVVVDACLLAPPKSNLMLPGVTYDVVLELALKHGFNHAVQPIGEDLLRRADEIWLTSSTKEVLAITTLDGEPVGGGRPGPWFWRMHAAYQDYKLNVMRGKQ